ncbi:MAG: DUF5335 family protein [Oligoflexus sp.]
MESREIPKQDWQSYFDIHFKGPSSKSVKLEILSMEYGDQTEDNWGHLKGLSYDPKDDKFCLFIDHLNHYISHPSRISVLEEGTSINAIEIEDGTGNKQIIYLKDPTMLSN